MIQVHLFEALNLSRGDETVEALIIDIFFAGPMGAPVFMFCMGIGLAITNHATPKQLSLRGVDLLYKGIILNIARYAIPYGIGWLITRDAALLATMYEDFFCVDILQFAGLAFFCFALQGQKGPIPFDHSALHLIPYRYNLTADVID